MKQDKHLMIPLRTDEGIIERLDKISAWLVKRSPGMLPKRSFATRACLLEGLALLEARMTAEQGATPAKVAPEPGKKPRARKR